MTTEDRSWNTGGVPLLSPGNGLEDALTVTIDSRPECVAQAAVRIAATLQIWCAPEVAMDMETCLVEAANNIIEHAYQGEADHRLTISIYRRKNDRIEILLIDDGRPIPAERLASVPVLPEFDTFNLESLPEGGFGMALIWALADNIQYESANGRNVMTLIKRLESF